MDRDESSHLDNLAECDHCKGWFEKDQILERKLQELCIDCNNKLDNLHDVEMIVSELMDKLESFQDFSQLDDIKDDLDKFHSVILSAQKYPV